MMVLLGKFRSHTLMVLSSEELAKMSLKIGCHTTLKTFSVWPGSYFIKLASNLEQSYNLIILSSQQVASLKLILNVIICYFVFWDTSGEGPKLLRRPPLGGKSSCRFPLCSKCRLALTRILLVCWLFINNLFIYLRFAICDILLKNLKIFLEKNFI